MKKKIIIISICFILIAIIGCMAYLSNLYDTNLVNLNKIETDPKFEDVIYNKVEKIGDDVIGVLNIEKIGLNVTIKEGTTDEILLNYIGHIEETATYDGNVALAAHNRGYENSFFARLNELEVGDVINYKTKFFDRTYVVDKIQVILETDWELLKSTKENKLTLITCIANKAKQRLCVQATEKKTCNITETELK